MQIVKIQQTIHSKREVIAELGEVASGLRLRMLLMSGIGAKIPFFSHYPEKKKKKTLYFEKVYYYILELLSLEGNCVFPSSKKRGVDIWYLARRHRFL